MSAQCEGDKDCQVTVWIYVDTSKQVGDREHLKVFASLEAALAWFQLNNPEGVAFEYVVRSSLHLLAATKARPLRQGA